MKKILLIQSAETQGNGTKLYLENRGHKVIWARSGLTALMMARNEAIDLILLDVALPDIEGLDLCHRFRVRQETRSIPIILLTSRGYTPERSAGHAFGPDDYLARPYTESELDNRIAAVLEARTTPNDTMALAPSPAEKREPLNERRPITEPLPLHEPRPALISVAQRMPKPNLKLVPKAEPVSIPNPGPVPASEAESRPGQDRERKTFLKAVPKLEEQTKQAAERSPATASKPEQATSPEPDKETASPLIPFSGAPDAVIDPATGLFGRAQFEAMFSKEFKRALRFKQQMSCMLISLNGEKVARKADEPLVKVIIELVERTIREVDTAAWWTGEAFIVLLPNTMRSDAVQAAARILEAVAIHPFSWSDATRVTMSIGVAGLPDKNIDSEHKLLEVADAACRRAQELLLPPPPDVLRVRR